MKNQALLSIIIPVYNVEAYLRECVDSVINQTYKNLEIILVDDGSTDSSGDICDEYIEKDERITVIHQKNSGLSQARNKGLAESGGDYIYFLDSDDYIGANALEKLLSIAEKDNSDIVFFDAVSFADTNDFEVKQNYIRKESYKTGSGSSVFSAMTENGEYHSAVPLLFFRKSFLTESKISFIPGILYEDMAFTYQIFCAASVVSQCKDALYHRRYRKNSITLSRKNKKNFTSSVAVYRSNAEFTENSACGFAAAQEYLCRCAFNVFNVYEKLGKAEKKSCKNEFRNFKKDILKENAFGNASLKMRCLGKAFWFAYKIFEKTVGRLLKGKK